MRPGARSWFTAYCECAPRLLARITERLFGPGDHVSVPEPEHDLGLRGRFEVWSSQITDNLAENGGGIFNGGDAQLFVTDTTFTGNHSSDHGGAIASEGRSNMILARVTVADNTSNGYAGGVSMHAERQHTVFDSTFTGNRAGVPVIEEDGMLSDDVAGGGAMYTDGGPLTILRTTFDGNSATEEGGALSIHNLGDVEITDSTITNNRAVDGGGVENSAEEVTFLRVTVSNNRASGAGGGIYNTSSGPFHLLDSTIRYNSGVIGGGLANAPDNAILVRGSLFANNTARVAFTE
jgi:predicted outer membrane repeat protein